MEHRLGLAQNCCVVVRGTTMLGIVVLRIVTTTMRVIRTTTTVFGLCAFCGEHSLQSELINGNLSSVH